MKKCGVGLGNRYGDYMIDAAKYDSMRQNK